MGWRVLLQKLEATSKMYQIYNRARQERMPEDLLPDRVSFFLILIFLLFICAYNAWVISPHCRQGVLSPDKSNENRISPTDGFTVREQREDYSQKAIIHQDTTTSRKS
jgi:hypothetical protein